MNDKSIRPVAAILGTAFLTSAAGAAFAEAGANPFVAEELTGGYDQYAPMAEGNCGGAKSEDEGTCGGAKASGEAKCGEARSGGDKASGEGKCGEGKAAAEGSCGGDKASGEGKCGG